MPQPPKHADRERERTDRSLDEERRKTDEELTKRETNIETAANDVLLSARNRADEVLRKARAVADRKFTKASATAEELALITEERCREDDLVFQERATADAELSGERAARKKAHMELLALERGQTDTYLGSERGRMDEVVGSRDDFLAVVSHDLRNLLSGLVMSADILLGVDSTVSPHGDVSREAQRIRRYVARMDRLVGDLLDIASIEAGKLSIVRARHDAKDLVDETLDVFEPMARAKKILLTSNVKAGSLLARYDYERILQVIANLVGNGIKFTREGGRINLVVEAAGDVVRFAVRDNGIGIEDENFGVIFDRYWQVDAKRRSGLGLGLYISKCIVEAHGGRIWGESKPGIGSTFYFTLPAATISTHDLSEA